MRCTGGLTPEFYGQVVFLHGLESGPGGTKGLALEEAFGAECPDFTGMDFQERMKKMDEVYKDRFNLILVGSSMGAILALHWANANIDNVKAMVLIAPAIGVDRAGIPSEHPTPKCTTRILAGLQDDLIPLHVIQDTFGEVVVCDDDHRMSKAETTKKIISVTWDLVTA